MLDPASLRPHYSRFLRGDRVLLTGHSHQAWPDVAREGVIEAFDCAAEHVDDKWGKAAEAANAVRDAVVAQIGGRREDIALAQNSHELLTRFLSALDLRNKPHLVTTSGEFHSMSRQLGRLREEGLAITVVDAAPYDTLSARLADAIQANTAAVLVSTVLFQTSAHVAGLAQLAEATKRRNAELWLDAYHHFGARPWEAIASHAFVSGGGYKYAQWGEGVCFLRVPDDCEMRPVFTGWFSDFAHLADQSGAKITYGTTHADRFAGSTYDPTSHFRAHRVIEFFKSQNMTIQALRELSLHQTSFIRSALAQYEILTPDDRGGFVSLRVADAGQAARQLREEGIYVDARADILRLGPAPYVTDIELDRAFHKIHRLLG